MRTLITNIGELTTNVRADGDPCGTLYDAAVLIEEGCIAWVGSSAEAPPVTEVRDAGGRAVIPGFVDSHSHLVFAGDRAVEFEARMAGQ
ncbi:MAG: amidohydrolase family protein, partial [Microbacterium sp.]|uniref:amidohydrolase family protein n=1 Tax=Microbacterium sp. TaxID=51671 RepID=UPI003BB1D08F